MVAKVYLSILSDEEGKATAMSGLKRLQGYVRTQVATNMSLRFAPEVRFLYDENAEYMAQVWADLCSCNTMHIRLKCSGHHSHRSSAF